MVDAASLDSEAHLVDPNELAINSAEPASIARFEAAFSQPKPSSVKDLILMADDAVAADVQNSLQANKAAEPADCANGGASGSI